VPSLWEGGRGLLPPVNSNPHLPYGTKCDDGVCRRPGGGGGGDQPKKCNGQPYTINTLPRPVALEDANGCLTAQTFPADSQAEAIQCAKAAYGNAVVEDGGDQFTWSATCNGFCSMVTFSGRDYAGAARCAYHIFPTCTILDIACP
jgi:hypothetical protein